MNELVIRNSFGRRSADIFVRSLAFLGTGLGVSILLWILIVVLQRGIGAIDWDFLIKLPAPPGMTGGGMANALIGTLLLTIAAAIISIPIGMMAGIYVAEVGRSDRFAEVVRFVTNTLIGVPSIIVGLFVYTLMVVPMKTFSGYAGAVSLAIIMLPVVIRTTEDMLRMVPDSLREAGLSLGVPRWRVTLDIVFRAAKGGLMTGVLLAAARVTGETAPLLFTALNSPYWIDSLKGPVANVTATVFSYAMSPYRDWQEQAWGASFLIMVGVLAANILARLVIGKQRRSR